MHGRIVEYNSDHTEMTPGSRWPVAASIARVEDRKNPNYSSSAQNSMRALGSGLGGAALSVSGPVNLETFAAATHPPLDEREFQELQHGYQHFYALLAPGRLERVQ